ncbi:hypothetical protein FRC11_006347 [Ceratobasidium sp. 423]|nr:hypothetical protein FRC11_006347 [Ceratobasidium sp. 423]
MDMRSRRLRTSTCGRTSTPPTRLSTDSELDSERVDDVLAITKAYPQAISARFLLHEHLTVTASATNGAGLFPPAPGMTISTSTVPTTPVLTAASVSTPGSVFTSTADLPTTALTSVHSYLKETFLLYSEQFDLRKEYFGQALVLEYQEHGGNWSGYSSRDDSRERPERGRSYDELRNSYGYPKPGDFAITKAYPQAISARFLLHEHLTVTAGAVNGAGLFPPAPGTATVLPRRDPNSFLAAAKSAGNVVMLVTNGADAEDEAMLNEDSLLCLVEDVDGACDAWRIHRESIPNLPALLPRVFYLLDLGLIRVAQEMCKLLQLQVKELLKFLISHDEMVWPPPPRSVHSLGEAPEDGANRIVATIDQLSVNLVEFAKGQGFEIYSGVLFQPQQLRFWFYGTRTNIHLHPNTASISTPNATFSPPAKGASPVPITASSHYHPEANPSPGPCVNLNRSNDMTRSQSPYSGTSSQGAMPNLASMLLVRKMDPTKVLSDPHGLEELARKGLDAVNSFMQDIATGHLDSHKFEEALVTLWGMTGHYPAEGDTMNEISRVVKSSVGQDVVTFYAYGDVVEHQPVEI